MAIGDFGSQLDLEAFYNDNTFYPEWCEVGTGVIAVGYSTNSPGNKTTIVTHAISEAGIIGNQIDSVDLGAANYSYIGLIKYPGQDILVFYYATGGNLVVGTVSCDSSGNLGASVIDSATIDNSGSAQYPHGLNVSGGTFAFVTTTAGNDGMLYTVDIATDGTVNGELDHWEYDGSFSNGQCLTHLGGDYYVINYRGLASAGTAKSTTIATNGIIGGLVDSLVWANDCSSFNNYRATVHIQSQTVMVVQYKNPSNQPWLVSYMCSSSGVIGAAAADTQQLGSPNTGTPGGICAVDTVGTVVLATYAGVGDAGEAETYPVDGSGIFGSQVDSVTFDSTRGMDSRVGTIRTGVFHFVYQGGSNQGKIKTYDVNTTGLTAPTAQTDAATNVEETTATLNGQITATGGEDADYRGFVWDTSSHGDPGNTAPASSGYVNYWTEGGAFGVDSFTHDVDSLSEGTTVYVRACAHNSQGWAYGSEETLHTKPLSPTGLSTSGPTYTTLDLTWTKGTGAEKTMIRRRADTYPTDPADGDQVYFDTGESTTDDNGGSGLSPGTDYYYAAFAWSDDGASGVYSDDGDEATGTTSELPAPTVESLSVTNGQRGDTALSTVITGTAFACVTGVSMGSGITVNNYNVDSTTQITVSDFDIDADAEIGTRDVSVTNLTDTGTLAGGFTVLVETLSAEVQTAAKSLFMTLRTLRRKH